MRLYVAALLVTLAVTPSLSQAPATQPAEKGQRLEDLTWSAAEPILTPGAVVVIPLGAASMEHGPHLKLKSDLTLSEYLSRRVLEASPVVVAPTLTYHHYPAFLEYPGSTSLALSTARELTTDVVRSLAGYGPRRFYVLNTGVSTGRALDPAAASLAADGILLRYTNFGAKVAAAARGVTEQARGSHADEIETSMMLYIDPSSVDMDKAVKDLGALSAPQQFTRQRGGPGAYSPTGIHGDPTLATAGKGRLFVEALVTGILEDIRQLRSAPLPTARPTAPAAAAPAPQPDAPPQPAARGGETCTPGDERAIRAIGDAFATHWANADAIRLGALWSTIGNIIHPDGVIETGSEIITLNRMRLFNRREYRRTRHPMFITMVRCLSADIAVADGKWELRGVLDSSLNPLPTMEGQCTLVVKRTAGWNIEAYRYTLKPPPTQTTTPTQKRPGMSDTIIK
jgi:creatinine amidohydrolase